jgi:hypothetical protein
MGELRGTPKSSVGLLVISPKAIRADSGSRRPRLSGSSPRREAAGPRQHPPMSPELSLGPFGLRAGGGPDTRTE